MFLVQGGMPAPEQASLVEEGQPQTRQEAASTGPGMEPETTATTILASVKEQVKSLHKCQELLLLGSVIKGTRLIQSEGQAKLYFAPSIMNRTDRSGLSFIKDDNFDPGVPTPNEVADI
uniref:Plakophilin 4 n=1 Tax=Neovison vison TaxID=452646 RepID=A0A8C7AZ45_NEOVI